MDKNKAKTSRYKLDRRFLSLCIWFNIMLQSLGRRKVCEVKWMV